MNDFWALAGGFLNSNFFVAISTILVGSVAFFVYRRQKIDQKRDAANIILMEIKNAETHLSRARETIFQDELLPENIFVMKHSNWHQYNYLFVRDFTDVEWELLNTFYEKCKLYDEVLEYENSLYKKHVELVKDKLQECLSQLVLSHLEEKSKMIRDGQEGQDLTRELQLLEEQYQETLESFAKQYRQVAWDNTRGYAYIPTKPFDDGKIIISTIKLDISTSTIGIKLEKIINQNARMRFVNWIVGSKTIAR